MCAIGLAEDATCRLCHEKEETAERLFCHREGLHRLRYLEIDKETHMVSSYIKK